RTIRLRLFRVRRASVEIRLCRQSRATTRTQPWRDADSGNVRQTSAVEPLRIAVTPPHVVVLGGGTGSHPALTGLRRHPVEPTSVVSVMDSGGSSGRLRDEYGFLPRGDARQCLVALGGDDESAAMLRALFTYRFRNSRSDAADLTRSLDGHNLGNL